MRRMRRDVGKLAGIGSLVAAGGQVAKWAGAQDMSLVNPIHEAPVALGPFHVAYATQTWPSASKVPMRVLCWRARLPLNRVAAEVTRRKQFVPDRIRLVTSAATSVEQVRGCCDRGPVALHFGRGQGALRFARLSNWTVCNRPRRRPASARH